MTTHQHGVLYRVVDVRGAPTRERFRLAGTVDYTEERGAVDGPRALVLRPGARWDIVAVNDRTTGYSSPKLARLDLDLIVTEHDRVDADVSLVRITEATP